ncbi:MAG: electron transport complex subunit E [Synergistaceae bacterium]|jgi:electron transport complex protein RnfE|nr:electron transport complex subunit E [Synergistaceae bacterium]
MKMNPLKIIKNGVITENPTLVQCIGLCPTLAVSTSAINGIGMGVAATAVLVGSNVAVAAIRKFVPDEIRIPIFIVLIAGFVTVVQLLISGFFPELDKSLGIFIPLIVVNCIILARAEAFAFKNGAFDSFFDGIGMGLGFTIALTAIGMVRELLGNGTMFDINLTPAGFQPGLLVILPPGGFIALGIFMGVFRRYQDWQSAKRGQPEPVHAAGCACCTMSDQCGAAVKGGGN